MGGFLSIRANDSRKKPFLQKISSLPISAQTGERHRPGECHRPGEYDIAPAVWRNDSQRHVEHLPCCLLKKTFKWWKTLTQEFHTNGQTVLLLKYKCFFTILYQSLTEIRPDTALLHYWSWCWVAETWNVIKPNFWNFWWFNNFVFTQSDYIIIHLKHSRSCYMRQEQIPNHCIVVRNQQNSQ